MPSDKDSPQHWDPQRYRRNAGFVAELGLPVLELLAPQAGESILDLGCGEGALTQKLVAAGCRVVAVDASAEQIAQARAEGLDAHVADGQALDYENCFDAVFSNAALHWMTRAEAVIDGVWRALKPGGRFVGEATLLRFYILHCVAIPVAAVILMAVHFWRIRKDGGISAPL